MYIHIQYGCTFSRPLLTPQMGNLEQCHVLRQRQGWSIPSPGGANQIAGKLQGLKVSPAAWHIG